MRPRIAITLALLLTLTGQRAGAQPTPTEHRPPAARPQPPPQAAPAPRPGHSLDRSAVLRRRAVNRQMRELLLREVRLLESLVGPLSAPARVDPGLPGTTSL